MTATVKCDNGHIWHSRCIDEPDVNACELDIPICPTCKSENIEIIETFYDDSAFEDEFRGQFEE